MQTISISKGSLTEKNKGYCRKIARQYNVPFNDVLQEGLIVEWKTINKKFDDEKHRNEHFLKAVTNRIFNLNNSLLKLHYKKPLKPVTVTHTDHLNQLIDSVIKVRPFDDIFYENLVESVTVMLRKLDSMANEIFIHKVRGMKWKEIRSQFFPQVNFHQFQKKVRLIKKCTLEVCKV